MIITTQIARNIKDACREVCGGRRAVEVGYRRYAGREVVGANFLLWDDDADLDDMQHINDFRGSDVESRDGWVALDCYCYNLPLFGREPDDALDTNVYVLLDREGNVRYASQDHTRHMGEIAKVIAGGTK